MTMAEIKALKQRSEFMSFVKKMGSILLSWVWPGQV